MGLIITPRQWSQKPPIGAQLNWGHSLTDRLALCYCPGFLADSDIIVPSAATITGSPSFGTGTRWGLGVTHTSAAKVEHLNTGRMRNIIGAGYTCSGLTFIKTGTLSNYEVLVGVLSGVNDDYGYGGIYFPYLVGWPYLKICDGYSTTEFCNFSTTGFPNNDAEQSVGFSVNGGTCRFYKNGVLYDTVSGATPRVPDVALGSTKKWIAGAFAGTTALTMLWGRELSAQEHRELYANPYQIFHSPHRYWFGAAAGGGSAVPVFMRTYRNMRG